MTDKFMPESRFTARSTPQAQALLEPQTMEVLGAFQVPATPSEAARTLGLPANRVTYHVRRLLSLELLIKAEQVGKRARYQVVATEFSVPYRLTALVEATDAFVPLFRELQDQFTQAARARAAELSAAQLEGAITLRLGSHAPLETDPLPAELQRFALSAQVTSFSLTAAQYAELQTELTGVLRKYQQLSHEADRTEQVRGCTAVSLTFPGALFQGKGSEA